MFANQGFGVRILMVVVKRSYTVFWDCWKNLIIVLVSQNHFKNTMLRTGTIHKQLP